EAINLKKYEPHPVAALDDLTDFCERTVIHPFLSAREASQVKRVNLVSTGRGHCRALVAIPCLLLLGKCHRLVKSPGGTEEWGKVGKDGLHESGLHGQPSGKRHLAGSPQQFITRNGGGILLLA